jgi:hypothetical protein
VPVVESLSHDKKITLSARIINSFFINLLQLELVYKSITLMSRNLSVRGADRILNKYSVLTTPAKYVLFGAGGNNEDHFSCKS